MGATGTVTLDFGAFPGTSNASVDVTGQTGIASGSLVEAWLQPAVTADHSADEHMIETLKVVAGNVVAGTGFTVYGFNTSEVFQQLAVDQPSEVEQTSPKGTLLYGTWNVGWAWS